MDTNKHYIRLDAGSNIIHGFSDAFPGEEVQDGDILINESGGRHFELLIGGEWHTNPTLTTFENGHSIPLYRWDKDKKQAFTRTPGEIQADIDALPQPEKTMTAEERLEALENAVNEKFEVFEGIVKAIASTLPQQEQESIMKLGAKIWA